MVDSEGGGRGLMEGGSDGGMGGDVAALGCSRRWWWWWEDKPCVLFVCYLWCQIERWCLPKIDLDHTFAY